jgi:hypothetical protein
VRSPQLLAVLTGGIPSGAPGALAKVADVRPVRVVDALGLVGTVDLGASGAAAREPEDAAVEERPRTTRRPCRAPVARRDRRSEAAWARSSEVLRPEPGANGLRGGSSKGRVQSRRIRQSVDPGGWHPPLRPRGALRAWHGHVRRLTQHNNLRVRGQAPGRRLAGRHKPVQERATGVLDDRSGGIAEPAEYVKADAARNSDRVPPVPGRPHRHGAAGRHPCQRRSLLHAVRIL